MDFSHLTNEEKINLAKDPKTSPEILDEIWSENEEIAQYVAQNPSIAEDLLWFFFRNQNYFEYAKKNPLVPLLLLEDPEFQLNIDEQGAKFSEDPEYLHEIALKAINDPDSPTYIYICQNYSTKSETLDYLFGVMRYAARTYLARNCNCSSELLTKLSTDKSGLVREAVANNLNTPLEILRILEKDTNPYVAKKAKERILIKVEAMPMYIDEIPADNARKSLKI